MASMRRRSACPGGAANAREREAAALSNLWAVKEATPKGYWLSARSRSSSRRLASASERARSKPAAGSGNPSGPANAGRRRVRSTARIEERAGGRPYDVGTGTRRFYRDPVRTVRSNSLEGTLRRAGSAGWARAQKNLDKEQVSRAKPLHKTPELTTAGWSPRARSPLAVALDGAPGSG